MLPHILIFFNAGAIKKIYLNFQLLCNALLCYNINCTRALMADKKLFVIF